MYLVLGFQLITETLEDTKKATFAVLVPSPQPELKGFPTPAGTCFFISEDGYFISARHVFEALQTAEKVILTKPEVFPSPHVSNIEIVQDWKNYDLILLKADFDKNKNKTYFQNKRGFDFIEPEFEIIPEGKEAYSFGYPLPSFQVKADSKIMIGVHYFSPRTTSFIVSSHFDIIGPVMGQNFPTHYAIDKALNYGNSGGPIIIQDSGKVISVCSRFQPVDIPQNAEFSVGVPSLYGITSSLKNIENELKEYI